VPFSFTDLRVGTGAEATTGSLATVNYGLWLYDAGASQNKGRAIGAGQFPFTVGASDVIPGFSRGVVGMRVGGQRRVIVPPDLAYGAAGRDEIPGNATLVFEVDLISLQ
jgi:FKBP-type peptidyl-prolyl cis-trans isomerase